MEAAAPFVSRRGRPLRIRAVRPADAPALAAMIGNLSQRSVALRYLTPRTLPPELAWREAERLVRDDAGQLVLVALDEAGGEQIVAVAELVIDRAEPAVAESAVVVADAYQGEGVGRAIIGHLGDAAASARVARIRAIVQSHNAAMRRLIAGLGVAYTSRFAGPEIYYEIPL